jgi:hypothetical protein
MVNVYVLGMTTLLGLNEFKVLLDHSIYVFVHVSHSY